MILGNSTVRSLPPIFHHFFLGAQPLRALHTRASTSQPHIPSPTPFVPDPSTFLKLIGRNLSQHAVKIPTWQALFSLTSNQLRELGVEPARTRRYLLWWRDRYRKGIFGVGGDLKNVKDGEAQLRVVEVPLPSPTAAKNGDVKSTTTTEVVRAEKVVVNEPAETVQQERALALEKLEPVQGMKVRGVRTIVGPYIQPVKGTSGSVATIQIQEGMWEVKRGVKVDGGERRKKQVRRKRLLQERKTKRA